MTGFEALAGYSATTHRPPKGSIPKTAPNLKRTPLDATLENGHIEVHEQADSATCQPEICEQLGFMHRLECSHCLQLNDHLPRNDEVQPISAIQQ